MKRNPLTSLPDLDPAVSSILGSGAARHAVRALPRKDQRRKARERAHQEERTGKRAAYDLPFALIDAMLDLAELPLT